MKRSDVTRTVSDLSRELGAAPGLEVIAARLGQDPKVMETYLRALVGEGAIEFSEGGYRVAVRTIGPTSQRELFQTSESGNHRPAEDTARFTPEELASIEESAQEESDVQPGADDSPERPESESGNTLQEPDRKPVEPQPRRQASSPARRPQQKARIAPGGLVAPIGRWQITVIRSVMAASGVGASVVAGYFSITRLAQFMPAGLAALLGSFIVAFSVIAFETTLVFIQRKSYFASAVFIALWGITVAFTLTATLAGFYNYFSALRVEHARSGAQEEVGRSELQAAREDEASLRERIVAKQSELRSLQKIVEEASGSLESRAEYGRVFYDAENRILAGGREIDRLQAALDVERQKEAGILATAPTAAVEAARPSQEFFDWVGGMIGIKASTLELITSLFPSLFIDLISSIGLAVALFLNEGSVSKKAER